MRKYGKIVRQTALISFLITGLSITAQAGTLDHGNSVFNTSEHLFYNSAYFLAQNDTESSEAGEYAVSETKEESAAGQDGYTDAEIAEMINNPLGNLWMLFSQNDTKWISGDALDRLGESDKVFNSFMLMPVMPMQLTDDVKYIFRPVIPIHSFDLPSGYSFDPGSGSGPSVNFDRETGLGDIVLWNAFATNEMAKPPNVLGAGFTAMLDTASDEYLGTGKWSAGPMGLAMRITDKWIYGIIAQHWWSFAGDSDRDDVSLSDIQYILRYRLTPETNIGMSPNISYNWEADSDDRLSLPVGGGIDTMIKLGPLPVKIGFEVYYYVAAPDNIGPEWQFRLFFTPVLPSPGWSKKPIF
jgi:hypothetical protein